MGTEATAPLINHPGQSTAGRKTGVSDQGRQVQGAEGHDPDRQNTGEISHKRVARIFEDLADLSDHGFGFLNNLSAC